MTKDSFTVALKSSYLKESFYRSKMGQFDTYCRAVMVLQEICICYCSSNENIFFFIGVEGRMWGAHRSFTAVLVKQLLFICDHCWIQHYPSISTLVISRDFFCYPSFWLKAHITFFLNYVSLCCDCYFWQFNSLWIGKLWNDCPLSFGINQLPGFKFIWQKL